MNKFRLLKSIACFLILIVPFWGFGQYDHQDVYKNKSGQELLDLLAQNFKPGTVLDYSNARDTMYGVIYNINDTVACIYSDHKLYLPPNEDPSTFLYMNGIDNGINAEHVYPQSKGAEFGNARSDMHHLFPSRVSTNEERSSLPFAEVNDNLTLKWFYKTQESSNKPKADVIDLYSEKGKTHWEPRESVKGDIARAVFYFYTMYKDQADQADPLFFESQKNTLCEWHYLDPVDSLEWVRNNIIAGYQGGKKNPYILDCSLPFRTYCDQITDECKIVGRNELAFDSEIKFYPNPATHTIRFSLAKDDGFDSYSITSLMTGKTLLESDNLKGIENLDIDIHSLTPGVYVGKFFNKKRNQTRMVKFIKVN